ncbi:hypothetical protein [Mesorhizobium abyssinicae]
MQAVIALLEGNPDAQCGPSSAIWDRFSAAKAIYYEFRATVNHIV